MLANICVSVCPEDEKRCALLYSIVNTKGDLIQGSTAHLMYLGDDGW